MTNSTDELMDILQNANSTQVLDEVLNDIKTPSFVDYMNDILRERDISIAELQRRSAIARTYMYQIMDGSRNPGRDKAICIALALELDITETTRVLKLTGNSILYPKNRRDAIIIYAINNKLTVADCNRLLENYSEAVLD